MLIPTIDLNLCAGLLREATDRISAIDERPSSNQDLPAIIGWVNQISRDAVAALRPRLAAIYPEIGWLGEEDRPEGAVSSYWLYDPVDGAYHFLQRLPLWSSSLVLVHEGQPVLSIVYDPAMKEVFTATLGGGAMCNGKPISVAAKTEAKSAVAGTAIPPLVQVGNDEQDQAINLIRAVAKKLFVVRPMAAVSLQLAYVAAGRLDAYWENGRDAADWLAGALLVREAGGIVSDLHGHVFGWSGEGILASNKSLHDSLLPEMAPVLLA
jgi:myo-inositol-1(or 4)-monophosphatase